mgnify:CR=1 FL=1
MKPDVAALLSAFGVGTAAGSVVTLLLEHNLIRRSERRHQQIETDRATYQHRMTRLIAANLCALIRSNRYRDGEREELAELVQELSDGAHRERFLDRKVQEVWERLVKKTAECGWLRLTDRVTEQDIADYTRVWEAWLTAARKSFGPLPESDRPLMRRSRASGAVEDAA